MDGRDLPRQIANRSRGGPGISVVLPVFNGEETIGRAIRSILEQSLADLELIVVDDGSTDGTMGAIREHTDRRLRILRLPHRGVVAAANAGTEAALAPFIARMDADDVAHPERLQSQVQLLKSGRFDVIGCQVRILDQAGRPVAAMQRYQRWINQETLNEQQILAMRFVELPLVNPTILARREYFELGFREGDYPEDYDLMLRAASAGMRFGKVDRVLLDWTDRAERITRNDERYSREAFMRCRRAHLLAGPLRGAASVDLWGVGQTGKPWLRWLQAQDMAVRRGYDVNPRKVSQSVHGVSVRHPDDMPASDGTPLVIAVGAAEARPLILPHLADRGYLAGRDAWFVA